MGDQFCLNCLVPRDATLLKCPCGANRTLPYDYFEQVAAELGYDAAVRRLRELNPSASPWAVKAKDTNPKDALATKRVPLHLWPTTASAYGALALLEGALKYGRSNFRAVGVKASVYYSACQRHLNAWFEGADIDEDSGLPQLAKALACIAILIEAEVKGNLSDDRMYPTNYKGLMEDATMHTECLIEQYADRAPKHYSKEDADK